MKEHMFVDVVIFLLGAVVLAFDRQIANAMNQFSVLGESLKKWPVTLPPWSTERFENWLRFIRFCGFAMSLNGIVLGLLLVFVR
jgi:hypothetical protein